MPVSNDLKYKTNNTAIKVGESQYSSGVGSVMHKMVSMYAVKGTASSGGYVSPFDPKGQTRLKLQRDLRDLAETCDKPPGQTFVSLCIRLSSGLVSPSLIWKA